jgi:hypothetical protein
VKGDKMVSNRLLGILFKTGLLFLCCAVMSCTNPGKKTGQRAQDVPNDCKPYFEFDQVDHYYLEISEAAVWDLEIKNFRSEKEAKQLQILTEYVPYNVTDTLLVGSLEGLDFVKSILKPSKFKRLGQLFCERQHDEVWGSPCIAIYRDVLVFRKRNQITGVAKICFECEQHVIVGTKLNTTDFGQSGGYGKLKKLLR